MKKKLVIGYLFLIILISFVVAANSTGTITTSDDVSESTQVNKAYQCLNDKISDKTCDELSSQERIFSLLATGKCKTEVLESSKNEECWPNSKCTLKNTAQAVLALSNAGTNTDDAEDWLLSKKIIPEKMEWFLQIESNEATTCSVSYDGSSKQILVGADKKITSAAGSCLTPSAGNWWLKVSQNCYGKEFEISCDKSFITTLLFKNTDSSVIHVSQKINAASAEGSTIEQVNSSCFSMTNVCDYEGSLWAAFVLKDRGEEISEYLPYLVSVKDNYEETIPEAFLYLLTGYEEFRNALLQKQKSGQYWDESGDKFYDTAIALYPLQYETPMEKTNSINWLLGIQGTDGCWAAGDIVKNAFILSSIWPRGTSSGGSGGTTTQSCSSAGKYCMSSVECEGQILDSYSCSGVFKCCDTPKTIGTCDEQGGEICSSEKECVDGINIESSDKKIGEICCTGACEELQQQTECELSGGTCRSYACDDTEESSSYKCEAGSSCCVEKKKSSFNWFWIILLVVLIILTIAGFFFKDKLREFWFRAKSFGGNNSSQINQRPRPSGFSPSPRQMITPRRIIPPQQKQQIKPQTQKNTDIDNVLKKLKEMGK